MQNSKNFFKDLYLEHRINFLQLQPLLQEHLYLEP